MRLKRNKKFSYRPSLVLCVASLGAYREVPMRLLKGKLPDLVIISGSPAYDNNIRLLSPKLGIHHQVDNHYIPGDILFQAVSPLLLMRAKILVLDLNPRVPTTWGLLIFRRLLRRPTILWGHAFGRSESRWTSRVRNLQRRLASGLITYTHTQMRELQSLHPGKPIFAAPNAMYSKQNYAYRGLTMRSSFIYVGRLDAGKKPTLLVEAFALHAAEIPWTKLMIVGDGPAMGELAQAVAASSFAHRIELLGHQENSSVLEDLYGNSIASVSPGYVGLSATQSLGFGVPMIAADNEAHAPEIEALISGFNADFFHSGDARDLAAKLTRASEGRSAFAAGLEIAADCANRYSAETMSQGIADAIGHFR